MIFFVIVLIILLIMASVTIKKQHEEKVALLNSYSNLVHSCFSRAITHSESNRIVDNFVASLDSIDMSEREMVSKALFGGHPTDFRKDTIANVLTEDVSRIEEAMNASDFDY